MKSWVTVYPFWTQPSFKLTGSAIWDYSTHTHIVHEISARFIDLLLSRIFKIKFPLVKTL